MYCRRHPIRPSFWGPAARGECSSSSSSSSSGGGVAACTAARVGRRVSPQRPHPAAASMGCGPPLGGARHRAPAPRLGQPDSCRAAAARWSAGARRGSWCRWKGRPRGKGDRGRRPYACRSCCRGGSGGRGRGRVRNYSQGCGGRAEPRAGARRAGRDSGFRRHRFCRSHGCCCCRCCCRCHRRHCCWCRRRWP